MKSTVFAARTGKEIRRDPLSYILCLGFPIMMLLIMSIVDSSLPPEAEVTVFHIRSLAPAIAYFGLTFVMLFTAIQVSKDRTTALLLRLYASPMHAADYVVGYTLPMCVLGLAQMAACFLAAFLVSLCQGDPLSIPAMLLSYLLLIPSLFLFVGVGMLFGTAVSEKSAPGLCSIIISAVGMIGGIWMDVNTIGGIIRKTAEMLPFYHGVRLARLPLGGAMDTLPADLLWALVSGVLCYILAVTVFTARMKKDIS